MRFDPPRPPKESALHTAGIIVLAFLLAPILYVICVPLRLLGWPVLLFPDRTPDYQVPRVPVDLDQTAAPKVATDGRVVCSACGEPVPFGSLSINEEGYFCPRCARA